MKDIKFKSVKLLTHLMPAFDLAEFGIDLVPIPPIISREKYSEFLIKNLHEYFDTDFCLLTQWHGFVMNYKAWDDEFLKFDYVASRWHWHKDGYNVGNGGFSLRSHNYCVNSSNCSVIWDKLHPEDEVCCRDRRSELQTFGIKFAPEKLAYKFAVENEPYKNQFGCHEMDLQMYLNKIREAQIHFGVEK